jgi:TIR domain-containing protein
MAHDIFISHSSKDKTIADAVCATFEANGLRCWVAPRDVPPGATWGAAIVDAIQNSRVMVLIFSDNANTSGQIAREVERAADYGVTIVPIRVEDVAPAQSLQYFLSNIHWLDALSPPLDRRLQEIAAKIKPMLEQGSMAGTTLPGSATLPGGPMLAANKRHARQAGSKKWWQLAVATFLILLAAVAVIWRPWIHFPNHGADAAQASKIPAEATVDPALVGRWSYVTTLVDAEVHMELSIDAAGRYTFRVFLQGEGTVQLKNGTAIVTDRKKKTPIIATYAFLPGDRLDWTTPTADPNVRMTLNYKRAGGQKVPGNPLVGRWRASTLIAGLMWDVNWDVRSDSSYEGLFENLDEGTVTAAHGEWEAKSRIGKPPAQGIYRNVTPDSFDMSHPIFQMLKFERVSPSK